MKGERLAMMQNEIKSPNNIFQNEDILTREQAWIQLKKPSLNTDLSEENLCGLWNRHKLRDKFISLNLWSYQD